MDDNVKKCGNCIYLQRDQANTYWGWCNTPARRIPPNAAFPHGTMPSTNQACGVKCEYFKNKKESKNE